MWLLEHMRAIQKNTRYFLSKIWSLKKYCFPCNEKNYVYTFLYKKKKIKYLVNKKKY